MFAKSPSIFTSNYVDIIFSFSACCSFVFLQIKFTYLLYSNGSLSRGGPSHQLRETSCLALHHPYGGPKGLISPGIYFHKKGSFEFLISWIRFLRKTNQLYFLIIHASTVGNHSKSISSYLPSLMRLLLIYKV